MAWRGAIGMADDTNAASTRLSGSVGTFATRGVADDSMIDDVTGIQTGTDALLHSASNWRPTAVAFP